MRMLRPAFAVAAATPGHRGDGPAPATCSPPIVRSRKSSTITSTRASRRPPSRRCLPPTIAALIRRLTLDLAGRIPTAAETRAYVAVDRSRQARPARRPLDGISRLRSSPGDRARHHADGRRQGQPARLSRSGRRREPTVGPYLPRALAARPDRQGSESGRHLSAPGPQRPRPAHRRRQLHVLRRQHQLRPVPRPPPGPRLEARSFLWNEGVPEPHVREWKRQRELPGRARLWHHPLQDDRRRRTPGPHDVPHRAPGRGARKRRNPPRTSRRKRKKSSIAPRKPRSRRRRPSSAPGPSWSSWRWPPPTASSFPGRSSIASGTACSARDWSCRSTRCTRQTRPAIPSFWPGSHATWPITDTTSGA